MAPKVEQLNVEPTSLGEGPHWDDETQSLYYVDIIKQTINKYVPSTKKHTKAHIGKNVSIIIPVKGKTDQFVITYGREVALITWDGESEKVASLEKLYEVDENTDNVLNDGKCDASGRLWAGTLGAAPKDDQLPQGKGSFYSFKNGKVTKYLTKIGISNGIAIDSNLNKFYYIDSFKGTIDQYDFDLEKGTITNETPVYTLFKKYEPEIKLEVLDGMTIDSDGNLWAAVFNQGRVIKVNPRNPETIEDFVQIPGKQVTSVAFGGPNVDELYVTTGRLTVKGETPSSPQDGGLYRVTGLNVKGLPAERIVL